MKLSYLWRIAIGVAVLFSIPDAEAFAEPLGKDAGKRACVAEARRLCPAEMKTFSRAKVEACMIGKIDQTSATCHAVMLQMKAERENPSRQRRGLASGPG